MRARFLGTRMISDNAARALHRTRAESFDAAAQRFREIGAHQAAEIALAAARDEDRIVEQLLVRPRRARPNGPFGLVT